MGKEFFSFKWTTAYLRNHTILNENLSEWNYSINFIALADMNEGLTAGKHMLITTWKYPILFFFFCKIFNMPFKIFILLRSPIQFVSYKLLFYKKWWALKNGSYFFKHMVYIVNDLENCTKTYRYNCENQQVRGKGHKA